MEIKGEWVTIAQAAERLGIAERQARRYAARLPDTDRTLDRTPAGRERTLVRLSALSEAMQKTGRAGQAPDTPPDNGPDTDRTGDRTGATVSVPLGLAMTAQRESLERVISEQAARIADLQASVDHERAQNKQLHDALAREQMLRALPPPAPEVIAPEAAHDADEPPDVPTATATEPPPGQPPATAAPTLWERLGFARRKQAQGSSQDGVE